MNADCGILSVALMRAVELATLQAHLITVEQDRLGAQIHSLHAVGPHTTLRFCFFPALGVRSAPPTFFLPIRTSILPGGGGGGRGGGGGGGGGGDLETKETSQ